MLNVFNYNPIDREFHPMRFAVLDGIRGIRHTFRVAAQSTLARLPNSLRNELSDAAFAINQVVVRPAVWTVAAGIIGGVAAFVGVSNQSLMGHSPENLREVVEAVTWYGAYPASALGAICRVSVGYNKIIGILNRRANDELQSAKVVASRHPKLHIVASNVHAAQKPTQPPRRYRYDKVQPAMIAAE